MVFVFEIGKVYYYRRGFRNYCDSGKYLRSTPAWNVFDRNGEEDWIPAYTPVYDSSDEFLAVSETVRAIEKSLPYVKEWHADLRT